jgi:hypothetical protein
MGLLSLLLVALKVDVVGLQYDRQKERRKVEGRSHATVDTKAARPVRWSTSLSHLKVRQDIWKALPIRVFTFLATYRKEVGTLSLACNESKS